MNPIELCNDALALVGHRVIMSLDDNSTEAGLCRRFWQDTVRETLRDGMWHCARKRLTLAPLAEPPPFGWAAQYQLPGDFIRLVELNGALAGEADCPLFTIEGRVLLMGGTLITDGFRAPVTPSPLPLPPGETAPEPAPDPETASANPIRLVYVRDITVPDAGAPGMGDMDSLLAKAAIYALAIKLCWPLQQNRILKESLEQNYEAAIRKARAVSSREAFEKQRSHYDRHGSWMLQGRMSG